MATEIGKTKNPKQLYAFAEYFFNLNIHYIETQINE